VKEDISAIDEIRVDSLDGAGGTSQSASGGSGGRVENTNVDVSGKSELYIWVAGRPFGRFNGGNLLSTGAGSTEISFVPTGDEFILGAGGGGGAFVDNFTGKFGGDGGGRAGFGGSGSSGSGGDAEGTGSPFGGDGGDESFSPSGEDGEGSISSDFEQRVIGRSAITTGKGAGASDDTNGEVKISFLESVPAAPSNLSLTVQ
jgi:hypothetical protein